MKIFSEELERKREERRTKRSATWGGFLLKVAVFILLILLIRFITGSEGKRFGDYWKGMLKDNAAKVVHE